ncbi:MAG: MATE family efflux transporter [Acidimicrobiales bacterium]|nr:MATE family efflux transporter [Acidimicrobiales bacterium]
MRSRLSQDGRELLALAVPALGALLAEPLYVLADTAVVGRLGTDPLAGLGVASGALLFGYGLCVFLAYGTTAAVARLTGAGEVRRATDQAIQGLWLAGVLGVALAVVGTVTADAIVSGLGATGAVADQAAIYLRISLLGAPAMLLMLAGVGYLRGRKDTVRPLQVAVGTAVLNLGLELVLILGMDRGIGASAAATVVAQWTGAACYLGWIGRDVVRQRASLTPNLGSIGRMLAVSAQLLVRNLSLTGTFLVGTSVATRIGRVDVAAHQVAFQVWMATALTMDAVAIAAQAMVGERLGASDAVRAVSIGRRVIVWSVGIGLALAVVLMVTRDWVATVFSDDPAVVTLAGFLLVHVALMAPLGGVAFALDGVLIGAGDQRFMARAMAGAAVVSVAAMVAGRLAGQGIGWLWAAIWLFMGIRSLLLGLRFASDRWQVVGSER